MILQSFSFAQHGARELVIIVLIVITCCVTNMNFKIAHFSCAKRIKLCILVESYVSDESTNYATTSDYMEKRILSNGKCKSNAKVVENLIVNEILLQYYYTAAIR